uniref:RxLR effector protein n=1 Tax=Phytophthora sojae TaxID=67593 RepID=G1FRF0_PHYSO|nr:Avh113 [Phytophthora sojae]AEK80689.1 Avh113 [Phytophthora sojae]
MRLSFVILAAMASLLASCDAASTSEQTTRSTMTSPGVVGDTPRFLRKQEAHEERGPQLQKIDDLLANPAAAKAQTVAKLSKIDSAIWKEINSLPSAKVTIDLWKQAKSNPKVTIDLWKQANMNPTVVANNLKKYPSLSREGDLWRTWKLYAVQYLRQHHSLNPTV